MCLVSSPYSVISIDVLFTKSSFIGRFHDVQYQILYIIVKFIEKLIKCIQLCFLTNDVLLCAHIIIITLQYGKINQDQYPIPVLVSILTSLKKLFRSNSNPIQSIFYTCHYSILRTIYGYLINFNWHYS